MNTHKLVTPIIVTLLLTVLFAGLVTMPAAAQDQTLGQAVNNPALPWEATHTWTQFTSSGEHTYSQAGGWYPESSTWYYGGSAAECQLTTCVCPHSGVLSDQADLKTVVSGPGTLTFYWKYSKLVGSGAGSVGFYVDGNLVKAITVAPAGKQSTGWIRVTISIGPGQHTLMWEATLGAGQQWQGTTVKAWVDAVTWTHNRR